MSEALPRPPGRLWGLIGRPSWQELRLRREGRELRAHPIWQGEGLPEGRGRRIVLVPGFLAGARSLSMLDPWLRRAGWDTRRAPIGRNAGPGGQMVDLLEEWLLETAAMEGGPVPVIGHSRGGQEARVLAVRRPELCSLLVTLGAPFRVLYPPHIGVRAPAAYLQVRHRFRGVRHEPDAHRRYQEDRVGPFPSEVPFVSVYSRTDGFMDWRFCLDDAADHVEVDCTHLGLATSIPAFLAIADALRRLDP
jgi:pimeloyl-ACP methyl ester carboxylesterase